MRRIAPALLAAMLLAASCGDEAISTTSPAPTTTRATTTTDSTAPSSSSTTAGGPTTTTLPTTTTTVPGVLTGPGLPDSLPAARVPWDEVGEGWALALYTASWGHPFVLYLLSPQDEIYEVFTWVDLDPIPRDLYDWRPDGKAVLVGVGAASSGSLETLLIDLQTGVSRTVPSGYVDVEGWASFTRPTGGDLVLQVGAQATEIIEVQHSDGSVVSTLLSRPRPQDRRYGAAWLYGLDGTTVVLGDGEGLALLASTGEPLRDLGAPADPCRPVRWWDESTILARCLPTEVIDYLPGAYYWRLWLVPLDGPATPLTAMPEDPVFVGDFGYSDAWRWNDAVYANWSGDCGAAGIRRVSPDGTTAAFDPDPGANSADQIVGTVGADLLVRRWLACDGSPGSLHRLRPDGTETTLLMPAVSEAWGVIDAVVLTGAP